ncbi:MAG: sensor domain-containing diguanylate cyclase [bacterium]|nr:sensor domain-containing diguanylate cyclase [bacterium]
MSASSNPTRIIVPDTPGAKGRVITMVLTLLCIILISCSFIYASLPSDSLGFILALLLAGIIECASLKIGNAGYLSASFFLCFLAALGPDSTNTSFSLQNFIFSLAPISFIVLLTAWIFRFNFLGDKRSYWNIAYDFSYHMLSFVIIGSIMAGTASFDYINAESNVTIRAIDIFNITGIMGLLSACGLFWLSSYAFSFGLKYIANSELHKEWQTGTNKIKKYNAVFQIVSAYGSVMMTCRLLHKMPEIGMCGAIFATAIVAALPIYLIDVACRSLNAADASEKNQILQAQLKGAKIQIDDLKKRANVLNSEVKESTSSFELLINMLREMSSAPSSDDAYGIICKTVKKLGLGFNSFVIFVIKDDFPMPVFMQTQYTELLNMAHILHLIEPIVREAAESQKLKFSLNEKTDDDEPRIFKDERSVICAPLIVSNMTIGAFYLGSTKDNAYTQGQINNFSMLASCAAPSIHNAEIMSRKDQDLAEERRSRTIAEDQRKRLEILQNMVQAMSTGLTRQHTLKVVLSSISELIKPAETIILFLDSTIKNEKKTYDKSVPINQRVYEPALFQTSRKYEIDKLQAKFGEGFLGQVIEHRSRIPVNNFQEYRHANILPEDVSAIGAPLMTEDDLLGIIYVGSQKINAFGEADVNLILTAASQTALTLKNAILLEETRRLALTDGLTGLYARRFFNEQLKIQVDDCKRTQKPACLILVDGDKFKQYNDTLGHPAGDALLKDIASILTNAVRSSDLVFRQGGDEFAIIMRSCPKADGIATAEKIKETFRESFSTHKVQVTASIGVACLPTDAKTAEELYKVADEALYAAKEQGRNRVCYLNQ